MLLSKKFFEIWVLLRKFGDFLRGFFYQEPHTQFSEQNNAGMDRYIILINSIWMLYCNLMSSPHFCRKVKTIQIIISPVVELAVRSARSLARFKTFVWNYLNLKVSSSILNIRQRMTAEFYVHYLTIQYGFQRKSLPVTFSISKLPQFNINGI